MSERIEKIADEILSVVTKKRTSGKTPENDVWVATYLPNREQIAVIFGDREVSNSYVQHRFNKDDRASVISTLEKLYGSEPRNHNEQSLDEDTVYDHSWYEVEDGDYPKRTKEGVEIKETTCAGSVACVGKRIGKVAKRKRKKVSEDLKSKLFKESILNDMPCETEIENHSFKYFMNEGKWYMGVDNCLVKTHDKGVMMETFDQIVDELPVTTSLLEDYSCFEMDLLMEEEITDEHPNSVESDYTVSPGNMQVGVNDENIVKAAFAQKAQQAIDAEEKDTTTKTSEEEAKEKDHEQTILSNNNKEIVYHAKDGSMKKGIQQDAQMINGQGTNGKKENIVMAKIKTEDGKEEITSAHDIETLE